MSQPGQRFDVLSYALQTEMCSMNILIAFSCNTALQPPDTSLQVMTVGHNLCPTEFLQNRSAMVHDLTIQTRYSRFNSFDQVSSKADLLSE